MPTQDPLVAMREVLEAMLPEELAAYAMRNALLQHGTSPVSTSEVLQVVHGPLRSTLDGRIPDEVLHEVLTRLDYLLRDDGLSINSDVDDVVVDVELELEPQATRRLPAGPDAVSVVAVAASRSLEVKLADELRRFVVCKTVHSGSELRRAAFAHAPLLVIIDASDPTRADVPELADAIRALPINVVVVIWAAEQRFGVRLREALGDAHVVALDRREGLDPLLDLITSRRS